MSYFSNIASILANKLNPIIDRLNFLSIEVLSGSTSGSFLSVVKTSDQTINDDDSLDNDSELFINIPSQQTKKYYTFDLVLEMVGQQNADSQFQIVDNNNTNSRLYYTFTTGVVPWENRYIRYNFDDIAVVQITNWSGADAHIVHMTGGLTVPANENPTLQLKWAQNRDRNNDLTIKEGSYIKLYPLN